MTEVEVIDGDATLTWRGEPYGLSFENTKLARDFIQFVGNRTGLDPYHQTQETLDRLAAEWAEQ